MPSYKFNDLNPMFSEISNLISRESTHNYVLAFYRFSEAVEDLEIAVKHHERMHAEAIAIHQKIQTERTPEARVTPGWEAALSEWMQLVPEQRFGIRTVYIYANIVYQIWRTLLERTDRFLRKKGIPAEVQKVARQTLHRGCEWFDSQVTLYRNQFIEHPVPAGFLGSGLVWSSQGAQISGYTGRGLERGDQIFLQEIFSQLGVSHPELHGVPQFDLYEWLCSQFHEIPPSKRKRFAKLVGKVGMASANMSLIIGDGVGVLHDFLEFYRDVVRNFPALQHR